jgi:hypothetical protein
MVNGFGLSVKAASIQTLIINGTGDEHKDRGLLAQPTIPAL